jgi:hypothetical protein
MFQSKARLRAGRASMVSRHSCLVAAFIAHDGDRNFKNRKSKVEFKAIDLWEVEWI